MRVPFHERHVIVAFGIFAASHVQCRMLYSLLRPLLFNLPPETAHTLALSTAAGLQRLFPRKPPRAGRNQACTVMGITFPNRVGLAAGLDKNAAHLEALARYGFGFLEVGTTTPKPQPGNPRPRLFRIPRAEALINRMGFNNSGVERLVDNVIKSQYRGILGINIGKNAATPIANAYIDYLICMRAVYAYADYIAVNVSSPNTSHLRDLQQEEALANLLRLLKAEQSRLADDNGQYVPLVLKIAPDLEPEDVKRIAGLITRYAFDGVIATNTTLERSAVATLRHAEETGGLSGAPLREMATDIISQLVQALGRSVPIIGVGGIFSPRDAVEKLNAGASLVQLYSGLIYRGPGLTRRIARRHLPESLKCAENEARQRPRRV